MKLKYTHTEVILYVTNEKEECFRRMSGGMWEKQEKRRWSPLKNFSSLENEYQNKLKSGDFPDIENYNL